MQPGSPRVRVPSFPRCLPYLLDEPSPFGVSDVAMMCLLIQFIKPLIRFLFVSTGFCSPASFRLAVTCNALSAGQRIMVQGSTPAHKGLSPSRFMTYIPVSQGTHAGHTQAFYADV